MTKLNLDSVAFGTHWKDLAEHKVFRLGDAVKYHGAQLFEEIERRGYSVGNLSAMNAVNRLKRPAFFVSDPWTDTPLIAVSSRALWLKPCHKQSTIIRAAGLRLNLRLI